MIDIRTFSCQFIVQRLNCNKFYIFLVHMKANNHFTSYHSNILAQRVLESSPIKQQTQMPQFRLEKTKKSSHFFSKFKLNQHKLRVKFKDYLLKERERFPLAYQHQSKADQDQQYLQDFDDLRSIRRQKNCLIEELRKNVNERNYHLHQKEQHQKTFSLLTKKMKKVQHLRKQHKQEQEKISQQLKQLQKETQEEKMKSKMMVLSSKPNLFKSRQMCGKRKLSLADQTRQMKNVYRQRISQQKLSILQEKQHRCITVRKLSQSIGLSVSRVIQQKKSQAEEVRMQRLFRQFAEKQQIKIKNDKERQQSAVQISKLRQNVIDLQDKIYAYRNRLAERRFDFSSHAHTSSVKHKNRFYTQSKEQQFSTNSQFFTAIRYKSRYNNFQ